MFSAPVQALHSIHVPEWGRTAAKAAKDVAVAPIYATRDLTNDLRAGRNVADSFAEATRTIVAAPCKVVNEVILPIPAVSTAVEYTTSSARAVSDMTSAASARVGSATTAVVGAPRAVVNSVHLPEWSTTAAKAAKDIAVAPIYATRDLTNDLRAGRNVADSFAEATRTVVQAPVTVVNEVILPIPLVRNTVDYSATVLTAAGTGASNVGSTLLSIPTDVREGRYTDALVRPVTSSWNEMRTLTRVATCTAQSS